MEDRTPEETASEKQPGKRQLYRTWHTGWLAIAALVIAVCAFLLGTAASRRLPSAAYRANNRLIPFSGGAPRRGGMMGGRMYGNPGTIYNAARLQGIVSTISGDTLTVRSNGTDHTVSVSSSTSYYKNGAIAKQSDLQESDIVSVIGTPDSNGNLHAQTIVLQ